MFEYYEVRFKFTPAPLQLHYGMLFNIAGHKIDGNSYESWTFMGQKTARDRLAPGREPSFLHPRVRRCFGAIQMMHILFSYLIFSYENC